MADTSSMRAQDGTRPLFEIAREIRRVWAKPYFGAVPYLEAMSELNRITDNYYEDSAASIVRYFLSNAATWRGEDARRIKTELRSML
jgi:hypothetical protein